MVRTCAYCDSPAQLTREHVFPAWSYKAWDQDDGLLNYLSAVDRFVPAEVTIRDVCRACNNGALSQLDAYARNLYEKYFTHLAQPGDLIQFEYNYDELTRWLLKMSFNSARAANQPIAETLSKYRHYILGNEDPPTRMSLFLLIVVPTPIKEGQVSPKYANSLPMDSSGRRLIPPLRMRVGSTAVMPNNSQVFIRHVSVLSYMFIMLLPATDCLSQRDWKAAKRALQAGRQFGEASMLRRDTHLLTVQSSSISAVEISADQVQRQQMAWDTYERE